uniref:Uncharacterized protein n=1 Tax=Anguilla anguilla TaxID=7936 RepID=A0A0E9XFR0_ANGAN
MAFRLYESSYGKLKGFSLKNISHTEYICTAFHLY